MQVIAEIAVVPIERRRELSEHVAACERILEEAGLSPRLHALGTEVAGDWDTVLAAVRRCQERMHEMGAPRVLTHLKLATDENREADLDRPVERVRRQLAAQ